MKATLNMSATLLVLGITGALIVLAWAEVREAQVLERLADRCTVEIAPEPAAEMLRR